MAPHSDDVCLSMKRFFDSLDEKDRRRYAAIEAEKLGYGGVAAIARLLGLTKKPSAPAAATWSVCPKIPPKVVSVKKGRSAVHC